MRRVPWTVSPRRKGAEVKARLYRMLPVLALIAVVVEGLGAGVKWG